MYGSDHGMEAFLRDGDDIFDNGASNSVRDAVHGGAGNEKIWTGAGNDELNGGPGDDRLWGERGDDLFVFTSNFGNDVIEDFLRGDDTIEIVGLSREDVTEVRTVDGTDVRVEFTNGASIEVSGFDRLDGDIFDFIAFQDVEMTMVA